MEIERKLRVADPDALRARLDALETWVLTRPSHFEKNVVFDDRDRTLTARGRLLRLRHDDQRWILTVKGPATGEARFKARPEWETSIGDGDTLFIMLLQLGFHPVFTYEKRREIWGSPSGVEACLDETPMGWFLELEGQRDTIEQAQADLGFSPDECITGSYANLWKEFLEERGEAFRDMVFA